MSKESTNIKDSKKPKQKGFFQAVTNKLKYQRLGDLLLSTGLISEDSLNKALEEQNKTKEQIGKILIRQGAISPVLLYRKLAEQWCVKASTIGLTLMVSSVSLPNSAKANSTSQQFTLASIVTSTPTAAPKQIHYPALFGSSEMRSDDTTAFTKWVSMLDRFETQLTSYSTTAPRLQMWKAELVKLQYKSTIEKITAVNSYVNKIKYVTDKKNWNKNDYWSTPIEFLSRGGDCEDFAIAKYASLRALGIPSERLRLAIVQDKIKNIPHAILIVYAENGSTYVLDNQEKETKTLESVSRYKPIFSINNKSWWLHKA